MAEPGDSGGCAVGELAVTGQELTGAHGEETSNTVGKRQGVS